jgi:hypothetical protein
MEHSVAARPDLLARLGLFLRCIHITSGVGISGEVRTARRVAPLTQGGTARRVAVGRLGETSPHYKRINANAPVAENKPPP